MKYLSKIAFGIIFATMPVFAMADIVTTTIPAPTNLTPVDSTPLKSVNFTKVDWSDVIVTTVTSTTTSTTTIVTTSTSTAAGYNYEASLAPTLKADGSFLTPVSASALLASSSMNVSGVSEGVYYWHARAVDVSGATSTWSNFTKVIVDNTAPTTPGTTTLMTSIQPATSTVNGLQIWSFIGSTDNLSGVARYEYNINSASAWVNNLLNTSFATTLSLGTHTLAVRAVDRAENISAISLTTFTVTSSSTSATTTIATSTATTTPKYKDDCKRGGWRTFDKLKFKNQGKCVSFVERERDHKKKEDKRKDDDRKDHEKEVRKEISKREKEIKDMGSKHKQGRDRDDD